MMRVERIKSPGWEFESKTDNNKLMFSSRNSGCADFCAIPIDIIGTDGEKRVKQGFYVYRDLMGHFVSMANKRAWIKFNNS